MNTSAGNPPGWWKISVSIKNLKKLDEIKAELEKQTDKKISYNRVIEHLIEHYFKSCSCNFINT